MIQAGHLRRACGDLALTGRPVIVHASLRSFGLPLHGGADALLDALLARGRTVVVPAFTQPQFGVLPPATMRPARNGVDYTALPAGPAAQDGPVYDAGCGLINPSMGVLPATLIGRPGAVRGRHPLNSFAAIGPRAAELIAAQSPADVYGPIRELAGRDGAILLIGVGLDRMTALHLAEQRSGRRLFLRWARGAGGRVGMVEVGSCSRGFARLEPVLAPYARTTTVGASSWRAYPARQALDAAARAIAADQDITHCPDRGCLACRDSIAGGPVGPPLAGGAPDGGITRRPRPAP
ncbi:AAC(3) family N-acetyltransferase [Nonomuraea zeae]|uniref:Aminoglycoside N(3)-acetyltransferase n=1 Tax=Nonomuraea zeae TaxID=1642303 RepID=A0A5S4GW54_9ACTN|nr:AAC(3) family N-acetyltransferase [Nonomuraea zeae]TMR37178.1 AAC(3) family N-acetyltransferase [Nonomuraea zeae]